MSKYDIFCPYLRIKLYYKSIKVLWWFDLRKVCILTLSTFQKLVISTVNFTGKIYVEMPLTIWPVVAELLLWRNIISNTLTDMLNFLCNYCKATSFLKTLHGAMYVCMYTVHCSTVSIICAKNFWSFISWNGQ